MKKICLSVCVVLAINGTAQMVVTENPNINFISSTNPNIYYLPIDYGGKVKVGKGVNFSDPDNLIPALNDLIVVQPSIKVVPNQNYLNGLPNKSFNVKAPINLLAAQQTTTESWYEHESDEEMASLLTASVGAKFGFGSFEASYKHVQNIRKSGKILLYIRETITAGTDDITNIQINSKYTSELTGLNSISNSSERLDKFINRFGSHFIASITYGNRIAIYAEMVSNTATELTEFSANFRLFTAGGSVDSRVSTFFSTRTINIRATSTTGEDTKPAYLNSFQSIYDFFRDLRAGTRTLTNAPISMKLTSIRTQFPAQQYSNLYSDLSPKYGQAFSSPYGVPKGTIIAWLVPNIAQIKTEKKPISSYVPAGWLICDGTQGTPNLNDRFLIGTSDINKIGTFSGNHTHTHSLNSPTAGTELNTDESPSAPRTNTTDADTQGAKFGHWHHLKGDTNPSDNRPPSYYIIYIIKN